MKRRSAGRRYREQVARRAQPKRQYRVTIRTSDGHEQATTVWAVDEWLARNEAMRVCVLNVNGQHVTYDIRED